MDDPRQLRWAVRAMCYARGMHWLTPHPRRVGYFLMHEGVTMSSNWSTFTVLT